MFVEQIGIPPLQSYPEQQQHQAQQQQQQQKDELVQRMENAKLQFVQRAKERVEEVSADAKKEPS